MKQLEAILLGAVLGFLASCAHLFSAEAERPECSDAELARLTAAEIDESVRACLGQTYEQCSALPAIRERYRLLREAWVRCE
jgi:hypothetical protein